MQIIDLPEFPHSGDVIYIKSTDSLEAEYFGQLLVNKIGNKWGSKERLHLTKHQTAFLLYDIKEFDSGLSLSIATKPYPDFEWWLFRLAIERGWQPFSKIGTFTRITEF